MTVRHPGTRGTLDGGNLRIMENKPSGGPVPGVLSCCSISGTLTPAIMPGREAASNQQKWVFRFTPVCESLCKNSPACRTNALSPQFTHSISGVRKHAQEWPLLLWGAGPKGVKAAARTRRL